MYPFQNVLFGTNEAVCTVAAVLPCGNIQFSVRFWHDSGRCDAHALGSGQDLHGQTQRVQLLCQSELHRWQLGQQWPLAQVQRSNTCSSDHLQLLSKSYLRGARVCQFLLPGFMGRQAPKLGQSVGLHHLVDGFDGVDNTLREHSQLQLE